MSLPEMRPNNISQHSLQFGGYDARDVSEGAVEMANMSSDKFPYASSRKTRQRIVAYTSPTLIKGFGASDKVYLSIGASTGSTSLFEYDWASETGFTNTVKQFAAMNGNIYIFPDKKFYDTVLDTVNSLEATWTGRIYFDDGELYGEPATANCIWTAGAAFPFVAGDAVTISGCTTFPENNQTSIIREIDSGGIDLYFSENIFTVGTEAGTVTIARTVPDMDFVCECNNRLWGCKGDTIYASALGDPTNFNKFDGVATDSYSVDVGSPGDFTGCFAYLGYPIFFKEESIYKVYGSKPSNYEAMRSASLGVATGSDKSLAIAGEVLYYQSRVGIMAYTGGIPDNISGQFGDVRYSNGVAGSDGIKYYISMQDSDDAWHLFVYDPRYGQWHREDSSHAVGFGWYGNLYMATQTEVWLIGNNVPFTGSTLEDPVEWSYETGDLIDGDSNKKDIKKINLRCELGRGATLKLEIRYDSHGPWTTIKSLSSGEKQSYYMPMIPHRNDHYRLKLSGTGEVVIHSLTREASHGSPNRL